MSWRDNSSSANPNSTNDGNGGSMNGSGSVSGTGGGGFGGQGGVTTGGRGGYTFSTVPGRPGQIGNWNTGGTPFGFGSLGGGITPFGGMGMAPNGGRPPGVGQPVRPMVPPTVPIPRPKPFHPGQITDIWTQNYPMDPGIIQQMLEQSGMGAPPAADPLAGYRNPNGNYAGQYNGGGSGANFGTAGSSGGGYGGGGGRGW